MLKPTLSPAVLATEAARTAVAYSRLGSPTAETTYERLVETIKAFQDGIAEDEEVGGHLGSFGQSVTVLIEAIGFRNPNLIVVHGTTTGGNRCTLVQHMTQVNILLEAVKAKGKPKRIGFSPVEDPHETTEG